MTQTNWFIIIGVVLIIGLIIYFNSCNKQQIDISGQTELIKELVSRSDSLIKVSHDKDSIIASKDSIINSNTQQKQTIYIIRNETNKKIARDTLRDADVRALDEYLRKLVRAN